MAAAAAPVFGSVVHDGRERDLVRLEDRLDEVQMALTECGRPARRPARTDWPSRPMADTAGRDARRARPGTAALLFLVDVRPRQPLFGIEVVPQLGSKIDLMKFRWR